MFVHPVRLMTTRRLAFALVTALLAGSTPALAVIGGIASQDVRGARASTLRIETSRGELCSGAAIAPELVLTAAHCLMGGGSVSVVSLDPNFRPRRHAVLAVMPHPSFVPGTTPRTQPGADLAMLRLSAPLPSDIQPVTLGGGLWQGEVVTMAGFGLSVETNKKTARRRWSMPATTRRRIRSRSPSIPRPGARLPVPVPAAAIPADRSCAARSARAISWASSAGQAGR